MARLVVLIDKAHPILESALQEMGFECADHQHTPPSELLPHLQKAFGWIIRSRINVDQSLLDQCPDLRFIGRMGIGLEHIDVDHAVQKGVQVFNSPEGSKDTVAEHAIGLLLGLMHCIGRAHQQVVEGKWQREENKAFELRHRTVGIVGYGNIGQEVAKRLAGFGCRVLAYDKFRTHYGDNFAREATLQELFEEADIITLHIPYLPENYHFVNRQFLQKFKKPIFLINTSRGLVLDTAALKDALESGRILGAGLDVIEYEEQSFAKLEVNQLPEAFQYLRHSDRVLITPHIAGLSHEVMESHAAVLADKIKSAFPG
ncbi:MAG TPA: NAD(P)-dependent oxidoreductase [Saprospiraceae bacterium]|nr:NAD(P)-dependent oxidoreductase [Saprospiraceae bacterium]HMQ84037.1 NAD(P)-dependent oxidoreductase [Saprospiraceae bacterium]